MPNRTCEDRKFLAIISLLAVLTVCSLGHDIWSLTVGTPDPLRIPFVLTVALSAMLGFGAIIYTLSPSMTATVRPWYETYRASPPRERRHPSQTQD